ncbi:FAD:protein FMN transferase [Sphingomonas sp. ASY06-1R]|jgi:thiamine biosynthesis lipoprotein|uniref:FAD:protein FMN transferase n=1 Tax=Sphingomonas sp. ASY06-1R TaxID=3445771 RepID=UPI003FA20644
MTATPTRIAVPTQLSPGAWIGHDPRAPVLDYAGVTMGTRWRVRLAAPPTLDRDGVLPAIQHRLDRLVDQMSHWEPDSVLGRYNRADAGTWLTLPPDFARVIEASLDIAEMSDGAFDPAIGRLVNLWGFGPVAVDGPPSDDQVAQAHATSGWRQLNYDRQAQQLRQPGGLQLDLSGIAKGYAVDAVAALLASLGVRHALVEIGGELVGRGLKPDGDPWWVDLETPPGLSLQPVRVALHDLAVATSGDYVRGAHTIDPATGRPSESGVISVSVLHPSAMIADAWASALAVLGPRAGMALAARETVAARMIARDADGLCETITPALAAMM